MSLDASATTDANGDPLSYEWTVTQRPAGSVAQVIASASAATSLTPDVDGAYEVTLIVEDGIQSVSTHVAITAYRPITTLAFEPTAAAYSRALDRVVVVGSAGLAIVDAPARTITSVAVPGTAVAVAADGLTAIVAADTKLTVVDLQTASVARVWPVAASAINDVFINDGVACAFPKDQTPIRCVDLTTGAETISNARNFSVRRHFDAVNAAVWGMLTSTVAVRFDFVGGMPVPLGPEGLAISDTACNELWPTDDGTLLIGACGTVFHIPTPTDAGVLGGVPYGLISAASTSTELVSIPVGTTAGMPNNGELRMHALPGLGFESTVELPHFVIANTAIPAHGELVFTGPHGARVLLYTTDGVYGVVAY